VSYVINVFTRVLWCYVVGAYSMNVMSIVVQHVV